MNPRLKKFLQELVRNTHDTVLPAPLEEKMVMDLYIQLEQRLDNVILERLSNSDRVIYQSMISSRVAQTELDAFLNDKLPNVKESLAQVVKDFEREYIETVATQ